MAAKNGNKSVTNGGAQPPRDGSGRFTGGNPGGGRKKMPEKLREAIRAACPEAVDVLKGILLDDQAKAQDRIRCAEVLLERAYGKPVQAVEVDAEIRQRPLDGMSMAEREAVLREAVARYAAGGSGADA